MRDLAWQAGISPGAVARAYRMGIDRGALEATVGRGTFARGGGTRGRAALTLAMRDTGDVLKWDLDGPVIDKHSTGGVGDKTTLVIAPLVAGYGLPVGKMSGRGLGFSGGTIDKLESIHGFDVSLSTEQFM